MLTSDSSNPSGLSSRNATPLILITGGAGGLGREIAIQCLARGAGVHVCDIAPEGLSVLTAQYGTDRIRYSITDVGNPGSIDRLFEDLRAWDRPVSGLVNNVGIAGARGLAEALSAEQWSAALEANLLGAIRCTQRVLPQMKADACGAIVSVSTSSVRTMPVGRTPYIVSKAALEAFALAIARESGRFGVRSNVVRPGMMDNERMHRVLAQVAAVEGDTVERILERELQHVAMRSMVSMSDVASMVIYLLSDASRHITGQIFTVDAGHEWES